jgi:hypothetical protein
MKIVGLLTGAALAAVLATGVEAQPAAPSPERTALARQVVDTVGGADQMKVVLQTVFQSMSATLSANMPPEQKHLLEVVLQKMQDRFIAATPQLIDGTVQVYADNLTEKELRDYLAWLHSDTGQSVIRKQPQIAADSLKVMMPVLAQVTQGIRQDVLDEACKQASCSAQDRQALAAAMDKAMPKRPG